MILKPTISISQLENYPIYEGSDLGLTLNGEKTTIKVYAPTAIEVIISFYKSGIGSDKINESNLSKSINGTWVFNSNENLIGLYYTLKVNINNKWSDEVCDPYAKMVGINGKRAYFGDINQSNPSSWEKDKSPIFKTVSESVIYELQIRDFSTAANSGIKNKGKFLAFTEINTKTPDGYSTGISYLKELGVTHIHILPFFDFKSIDESNSENKYNWGYDPLNYNVPEGSFSTNANDPFVRINEAKQMIKSLHDNGLRIVMDVVYNHTGNTENSNFNQLVPNYYYRLKPDGSFSDAAACGNETASEKPMMQKFIIESLVFWVNEYHIDGFRFDLMGIHDIETMNKISDTLHKIKPDILLYGEGWTAKESPLPSNERALKENTLSLNKISVFSDEFRDGIKGKWNEPTSKGFVSGNFSEIESVKFGIVGAVNHPQIDYNKVNYSKKAWAKEASQCIAYVSCHDDLTLFDKINLANPKAEIKIIQKMNRLSNTIILTSQGIPFIHAGAEFFTTKNGNHNSYNAGDATNQLNWDRRKEYAEEVNFYKELIQLKKTYNEFNLNDEFIIKERIKFLGNMPEGIIAYSIEAKNKNYKRLIIYINARNIPFEIKNKNYKEIFNKEGIAKENTKNNLVDSYSASIFMEY